MRVSVPSSSNRHSSTRPATSEKIEKFVPVPSKFAPNGYGSPGQMSMLATYPNELVELSSGRASAWGVAAGYHDIGGNWVPASPETAARVLDAMSADGPEPPPPGALIVRACEARPRPAPAGGVAEDGSVCPASAALPAH